MPLMHGKSKKAFKHNVEVEMHEHPGKEHHAQNLAIAYSIKRKAAKKHAHGGEAHHEKHEGHHMAHGGLYENIHAKQERIKHGSHEHMRKPGQKGAPTVEAFEQAEKTAHKMAKGGMMTYKNYQSAKQPHENHDFADLKHYKEEEASGFVHHEGNDVKHNKKAMHEDDRMLNQHGAHEEGPEGHEHHMAHGGHMEHKKHHMAHGGHMKHHYAHGGEAHPHQSEEHEKDMVGKIMKQREHVYAKGGHVKAKHHYSHGGKVANDTHAFEQEFHEPDQFDDLVKDDDLEFHYTGDNSGDHLGDAREDHDRHDMVSQIMKSRKKKDKMPKGYPG